MITAKNKIPDLFHEERANIELINEVKTKIEEKIRSELSEAAQKGFSSKLLEKVKKVKINYDEQQRVFVSDQKLTFRAGATIDEVNNILMNPGTVFNDISRQASANVARGVLEEIQERFKADLRNIHSKDSQENAFNQNKNQEYPYQAGDMENISSYLFKNFDCILLPPLDAENLESVLEMQSINKPAFGFYQFGPSNLEGHWITFCLLPSIQEFGAEEEEKLNGDHGKTITILSQDPLGSKNSDFIAKLKNILKKKWAILRLL